MVVSPYQLPQSRAPRATRARAAPSCAEPAWASGSKPNAREVSWPERPRTSLAQASCSRVPRDLSSQTCAKIYAVTLRGRPGSQSPSSSSSSSQLITNIAFSWEMADYPRQYPEFFFHE
eukprot:8831875-Pyramimonas_sp.AAC.1